VNGDLDRRIARLRQGDHLCLIYDSVAEQDAALVSFFKGGLAAGERCLFVGHLANGRRIERALVAAGVRIGGEIDRGAIVLLTEREMWLPDGRRFEPGELLDVLRQAEQQALDDGFSGLRATWDMTWVLAGNPDSARLVELEAQLNRFLAGSHTCALCRYPRIHASAELVQDVLRTHPLAVLGDQLCPNVFYEPPAMVLGDHTPEERVDWMIAQLRQARFNEQKLEEVTRRLSQNRGALARADKAKEELLTMLAHELRNPLGTISNALQVLRLQEHEGADETWKRTIDAAERQVLHQAILVDEMLEASRVTRGEIELNCEHMDLVRLVRETVEGYRETLRNANLKLDLELPERSIRIYGDRLRLSQAVANLLRNSAKFTSPGGHVVVRVRPDGRRAEIRVCDSGMGIHSDVLPHVFEVFTQADRSLDRAKGGLGVGLAVVKGLIEMHGGEVQAHSEGVGKGAEFTLRLPMDTAAAGEELEPAAAEAAAPARNGHRRILVVEDNPDAAATLRDFLELSGHEVALASSGIDGVAAAREFHPEVVLCDLGLPGMDGFQVASELRRDPTTSSAKLIAVTGYGGDEDRRRSKEAGFDMHLTKPVDPAQLRRLLQDERAGRAH